MRSLDFKNLSTSLLSFASWSNNTHLFGYLRPPLSPPSGSPLPEQAVSGAMPRDHRFGLDENECFGPVGPDLTDDHPEQAIESIQAWGAAACACKRQVAVEERPPPMPNGA